MAKDKEFEKIYRAIGLQRLDNRIINRKFKKSNRNDLNYSEGRKRPTCNHCGSKMSWCNICDMWSSNCCETYGTCMCS